eukprot:4665894-Prymnesium_polylepis.1
MRPSFEHISHQPICCAHANRRTCTRELAVLAATRSNLNPARRCSAAGARKQTNLTRSEIRQFFPSFGVQ